MIAPVSDEANRSYAKVPIKRRFDWIEEMIQLEAGLPREIQEAHRRYREAARRHDR
ncbi:MAG: hypothetical protein HY716_10540 [Planctomycetes bacterium]|nr:hypothetical protein [Planctomycetota bacterium]